MIYPWQQAVWQQAAQRWHALPHAILLSGQQGTGKMVFAEHLAQALLCEHIDADKNACGMCSACHLFSQHSHPDCMVMRPETEEGNARKLQQIKVDAVREVLAFAQLSSHQGGRRVIIIEPAEALNLQAANALLKVLEEPPANVVFILVSHHSERLLPTILSRLQVWHLPTPSADVALNFLQQQGITLSKSQLAFQAGAPLLQEEGSLQDLRTQWLAILAKPRLLALLDFAAEFDKHKRPLGEALDWLYKWLVDVGLARQGLPALYYPEQQSGLNTLTEHSPQLWQQLVDKMHQLMPFGQHTLNVKLQLEDLSIDYLNLMTHKEAK